MIAYTAVERLLIGGGISHRYRICNIPCGIPTADVASSEALTLCDAV